MPSLLAQTYGQYALRRSAAPEKAYCGSMGKTQACGASRDSCRKWVKRASGGAAFFKAGAYNGKMGKRGAGRSSGSIKRVACSPAPRKCAIATPLLGSMRHARRFSTKCSKGYKKRGRVAACGATGAKRATRRSTLPQRVLDNEHMVGPAQETDAMHAERHSLNKLQEWSKVCPRCLFLLWRRAHKAPEYLMPKPKFMSGAWGIGCIWCAASKDSPTVRARRQVHMRENASAGRCKQAISRASKWSVYGQDSLGTIKALHIAIHQHETTDLHRISKSSFLSAECHFDAVRDPRGHATQRTAHSRDSELDSPMRGSSCDAQLVASRAQDSATICQPKAQPVAGLEQDPSTICRPKAQPVASREQDPSTTCQQTSEHLPTALQESVVGSVTDPFRGRVPQCQDWLDCWAESTSAISSHGSGFQA